MLRRIEAGDREIYLEMAGEFYRSEAVAHPVPEAYLLRTFDELMGGSAYADCMMLELEGKIVGYALLAKTFSQEAGGMVCWVEELYVREPYRGCGLGREVFAWLDTQGWARLRLEVEPDNSRAIDLYRRMGYRELPYSQMIKGA